jgi:glutaredoxin
MLLCAISNATVSAMDSRFIVACLLCVAAAITAMAPATARAQASPEALDASSTKVRLSAIPTKRAAERKRAQQASKVVLYRTAWCGYCKRAAAYMHQQKIQFVERDIEVDDRSHAEYQRLGGKGSIPLIQFGDKTMMGFAQETFDQYYAEFKKTNNSAVLP